MKLIRLLDLGRTLVVGDIPMGRYQWVGRSGLPRFAGRRPAHLARLDETKGSVPVSSNGNAANSRPDRPYQASRTRTVVPVSQPVPAVGVPVARPSAPSGRATRAGWLAKLRAMVWRKRNPFSSPGGVPEQASLRLDTVRVVRNDLSDSDFEVVAPGRSRALRPPPKASAAETVLPLNVAVSQAPRAPASELPMARVGGRA